MENIINKYHILLDNQQFDAVTADIDRPVLVLAGVNNIHL